MKESGRALPDAHLSDDEAVAKMGHPDWGGLSLLQDVLEGVDEGGRVVKGLGAEELEAQVGGGFFEGYVDVVEDFYVVAEEADGLDHDGFVAFGGEGFEGVFDCGT